MFVRGVLLCCALAVGAWAAEEPAPGEEQDPVDEQEIDAHTTAGTETRETAEGEAAETSEGESPDIFIPSENISENIAVKFPVDI